MTATRRAALLGTLAAPALLHEAAAQGAPPTTTQGLSRDLSAAPRAANPGRWERRAPLPFPRTELAWATVWDNKLYLVGGYDHRGGFQASFNQAYDPQADRWADLRPIPRGGNHVGIAAMDGVLYCFGGFIEQNRVPYADNFAYEIATDTWRPLPPLERPRGALCVEPLNGRLHVFAGRDAENVSVGWHDIYDPRTDRWTKAPPLPGARDHIGHVTVGGYIHAIAGRFNTFEFNTPIHHVYAPGTNSWKERAPLPTPRSGLTAVHYRDRIVCTGGEGVHVFAQVEAYDPVANTWESLAPMPTPRHGVGGGTLGDWVHVAGGGPVVGGALLSRTHEAFTLG